MKTLLLATSLFVAAPHAAALDQQTAIDGTWRALLQDTWTRCDGRQWVSFQLEQDMDRRYGISIPTTELEGLGMRGERWTASDVRFNVRRDAGTVAFQGDFADGRGKGTWGFTPNSEFVSAMRGQYKDLSLDQVFKLAIHDVSRPFITALQAQGYSNLTIDELTKMRIHGVDAEYIAEFRKAGYDKLTVQDLIKTRIHGATPAFVQELKAAGFDKLTVDELVKMRIHGVTPDFIREIRALGYKDLPVDELVKLRIHGVTPAFLKEMRDLGYKDLALEDAVKMRIHGVTPEFIKQLRDLGYSNVSANDLVRMRIHGVTPEFIRDVRAAGFKEMTPDDLVDFSIHGRRHRPYKNFSASGKRPAQALSECVAPSSTATRRRRAPRPESRRIAASRRTLATVSLFQSLRPVSAVPTPA